MIKLMFIMVIGLCLSGCAFGYSEGPYYAGYPGPNYVWVGGPGGAWIHRPGSYYIPHHSYGGGYRGGYHGGHRR